MGLLVTHLAALVPEQVPPGVPTRGAPLPDETGWVDLSGSSDTLVITAVRL